MMKLITKLFKVIAQHLHENRGNALRKELEDVRSTIQGFSDEENTLLYCHLSVAYINFLSEFGSQSSKDKIRFAKHIKKIAGNRADCDVEMRCALFLLCSHIEAQALLGKDALFVKKITGEYIKDSQKVLETDKSVIEIYLRSLGFELTDYGAKFINNFNNFLSGNGFQKAINIGISTIALDVYETKHDIVACLLIAENVKEILDVLKHAKNCNLLTEEEWKHYTSTLWAMVNVGMDSDKLVEKLLSDPVIGKKRLAKNMHLDELRTSVSDCK